MNRALEIAGLLESLARHDLQIPLSSAVADHFGVEAWSPDFCKILVINIEKFELLKIDISASEISDRAKGLYLGACSHLMPYLSPYQINNFNQQGLYHKKDQIDLIFLASDVLPHEDLISINQFTIDSLLEEIDQLCQQVVKSNFDDAFSLMVLSSFETIKLVIRNYSKLGPDGAAKIYGSASAQLGRLLLGEELKDPSKKSLAKRSIALCKKVGGAIIFASAVVGGANDLLEDGSDLLGLEMSDDAQADQDDPAG